MPTYEYECERCNKRFELFQSITDRPRQRCPTCRGRVRKLIGTGGGLLFKGSGFYQTDYRSPDYRKAVKAETTPKPSGEPAKKKGEAAGKEKPR